jgi:hypothetical protein
MRQETLHAIKLKNAQVLNVPNATDPADDRMRVHPQGLFWLNEMPEDIPGK